ncbi:hypothetical protein F4604DRAFT_219752 [Suillus subluteus]|nr:hypothetical protein F4604DRAFT_219752 [Suillus subluteus]
MDINTFLTVSFSVNGGGGSVEFDMILFDCTGGGDTAARCWIASTDVDMNAILVINATDLTTSHVRVQCRILCIFTLLHFTPKMQVVNPIATTILHLLRTAATLCMGIIFLYLAHSEPKIKYYAFYAGAHAIVLGTFRLLALRGIYRNALVKKNEATKPQSSAETAHEATGTGGILEDAKPRGVSENADLLV